MSRLRCVNPGLRCVCVAFALQLFRVIACFQHICNANNANLLRRMKQVYVTLTV